MAASKHNPYPLDLPIKKGKLRQDNQSWPSNTQIEAKSRRNSSKALQRNEISSDEEDIAQSSTKNEKRMKKRKRVAGGERSDTDSGECDVRKKGKEESKRIKETKPDGPTTSNVSTKRRKNKTGFPDPRKDTSLSDQTQKCLAYAFLQFHRPSRWKFNKARQNWLIRNIWSNEAIPEAHLPLALAYLAKVQGGVRANLLQSCRAALESPKVDGSPSELVEAAHFSPTPAEPPALLESENFKRSRARALIDILSTPEAGSP